MGVSPREAARTTFDPAGVEQLPPTHRGFHPRLVTLDRFAARAAQWSCRLKRRVLCERKLLHHPPADEVFLNDPFQHRRGARMIPDRIRVNDGDRAVRAHPQAIHLAANHLRLRAVQSQFLQAVFEKGPRFPTHSKIAALRFGLVGTQKDVPAIAGQSQPGDLLLEFLVQGIGLRSTVS